MSSELPEQVDCLSLMSITELATSSVSMRKNLASVDGVLKEKMGEEMKLLLGGLESIRFGKFDITIDETGFVRLVSSFQSDLDHRDCLEQVSDKLGLKEISLDFSSSLIVIGFKLEEYLSVKMAKDGLEPALAGLAPDKMETSSMMTDVEEVLKRG